MVDSPSKVSVKLPVNATFQASQRSVKTIPKSTVKPSEWREKICYQNLWSTKVKLPINPRFVCQRKKPPQIDPKLVKPSQNDKSKVFNEWSNYPNRKSQSKFQITLPFLRTCERETYDFNCMNQS